MYNDQSRSICKHEPWLSSSLPANTMNNNGYPLRCTFQKKPFIIGVAGGTASGKSTVCSKIIERLGPIDPTSIYLSHEKRVVLISQDSFYRKLTEEDRQTVAKGMFNFDHPSAFDIDLMVKTLRDICNGKMVRLPVYNYNDNEISEQEEIIYPADVVLFEGLLLFYFSELREIFHMKVFVDTDSDTRLSRRVIRDVKERNRDLGTVLTQYLNFVKPSFEEFCLPTKKYADIIVPRGPENEVAVDLIVTQVRSVYEPSIRHQSIKYHDVTDDEDDDFRLTFGATTTKRSSKEIKKKKSKKATKTSNLMNFDYEPIEKFRTSVDDDSNKIINDSVPRSKPIEINPVKCLKSVDNDSDDLIDQFDDDDLGLPPSTPSHVTYGTNGTKNFQRNFSDHKSPTNESSTSNKTVTNVSNGTTQILLVASR